MAFSDRYLQRERRPRLDHVGANTASWAGAGLLWFGAFFLPLYSFGWWAFAFPPWLFVVAAMTPVMLVLPIDEPIYGSIVTAILWIGTSATLLAYGFRKGKIAIVSSGVHLLLPILAMLLAFWAVSAFNDGKIPGSM
jgi:FtsH-binding integral membrane protein